MSRRAPLLRRRTPLLPEFLEQRSLLSSLSCSLTTDQSVYQVGKPIQQVNQFGTFTVSNPNAPQGMTATLQITNTVTVTLTTDKQDYELGEPVQVTVTEVNTASVPITTSWPSASAEQVNVYQNGQPLSRLAYPQFIRGPSVVAAGQVYTFTQTINIIPDSGPYTLNNLTGTFDVAYGPENDPTQYTTPIQVEAPTPDNLVTSLTTNQTTYDAGQTVNLTFTETNAGTQPISVLTGASSFQVSQNGTVVWRQTPAGMPSNLQPVWTTLKPGQSYSQTATWDGTPNVETSASLATSAAYTGLTGSFTVTNQLDLQADTASFQILPTNNSPPPDPAPPTPVSPVTATVTPNHSVYVPGQVVDLAMTLDNTGKANVTVAPKPAVDGITIIEGSTVIYRSSRTASALASRTIKPYGSIKLALDWSARPNQSGIKKLTPGTYTVDVVEDGYSATATFRIVGR